MILVDTSILIDIVQYDARWALASLAAIEAAAARDDIAINDVVYAEISTRYANTAEVDAAVSAMALRHAPIPRAALFLAGKVHLKYRQRGGIRTGVLSDFFIGAHAAVEDWPLLTRDTSHVQSYFPTVRLVTP